MQSLISYTIDGLSNGALYGLIALSIVFIYRSTRLVNLAQGELAMMTTWICWWLLQRMHPALAVISTLLIAMVLGALFEVLLFRRVGEGRDLNAMIVSVGLFTILNSVALWGFGAIPMPFPSPFGDGTETIGEIVVSHQSLGTLGVSLAVIIAVFALFQFTKLGLALRGTAENWLAARLMGIPVKRMFTVGWAISSVLGAVAGMLAAPKLFLSPAMMQSAIVYAVFAAVLGGLDSPAGAVLGGLIIGVVESVAGSIGAVGSELKTVVTVALVIVVLLGRPTGLLGTPKVRKV